MKHNALKDFFLSNASGSGVAFKNKTLKKEIIAYLNEETAATIPDLSKRLNTSIPKTTLLVNELISDGVILDMGKINSTGGRRANIYGLASDAGFFIGVDVRRYNINIALMNFRRDMVKVEEKIPYPLENTQQSLQALIKIIENFIAQQGIAVEKILSIGINLSGRVNNINGYSYSYFHFQEEPLAEIIEKALNIKTFLENDSNAMAFGELSQGVVKNEKNIVFINLDYGTGAGIIIDGKVYYGKSGFSGEFGHIPFVNNDIICGCGKKGCLETEVSGQAFIRKFKERIKAGSSSIIQKKIKKLDSLKLEQLIEAVQQEDVLAIELIAELGEQLGKGLAILINMFNPELVILGGSLSACGEYLRLPVKSAINKFSLSLVNNDTQLKTSELIEKAGVYGACLIARSKVLSF